MDFPDPVGPVTSTAPFGRLIASWNRFCSPSCIPSESRPPTTTPLSRMRITTPSPLTRGRVTTRISTRLPFELKREAAVLWDALLGDVEVGHDLDPRDDAVGHPFLDGGRRSEHAVDAEQDMRVALLRVHVDVRGAMLDRLRDERVHELDDGGVRVGVAELDVFGVLLLLLGEVFDRVLHAHQTGEQQVEVLDRGGGRSDPAAGHHADVVDRQDVRRARHRDEQRAVVSEADGYSLVALGGLGADQVDGAHVQVVDGEVDVVEAEALGDNSRQLVMAEDPALDEYEAGRAPLGAGGGDRLLDGLLVGETEIDDDFSDHARGSPRMPGRVKALLDAPRGVLGDRGGVLCALDGDDVPALGRERGGPARRAWPDCRPGPALSRRSA